MDETRVLPRDRGNSLPRASLTDSRIKTDPLKSMLTELPMKALTTSETSIVSSYIRGSWPAPTSSPRLVFWEGSIAQDEVDASRAFKFCHSLLSSCECQLQLTYVGLLTSASAEVSRPRLEPPTSTNESSGEKRPILPIRLLRR